MVSSKIRELLKELVDVFFTTDRLIIAIKSEFEQIEIPSCNCAHFKSMQNLHCKYGFGDLILVPDFGTRNHIYSYNDYFKAFFASPKLSSMKQESN